jgi:hypothetical protein
MLGWNPILVCFLNKPFRERAAAVVAFSFLSLPDFDYSYPQQPELGLRSGSNGLKKGRQNGQVCDISRKQMCGLPAI